MKANLNASCLKTWLSRFLSFFSPSRSGIFHGTIRPQSRVGGCFYRYLLSSFEVFRRFWILPARRQSRYRCIRALFVLKNACAPRYQSTDVVIFVSDPDGGLASDKLNSEKSYKKVSYYYYLFFFPLIPVYPFSTLV